MAEQTEKFKYRLIENNTFFLRIKARVFLLMHGIQTGNACQPSFGNDL
jgi:hypothetical protein